MEIFEAKVPLMEIAEERAVGMREGEIVGGGRVTEETILNPPQLKEVTHPETEARTSIIQKPEATPAGRFTVIRLGLLSTEKTKLSFCPVVDRAKETAAGGLTNPPVTTVTV